MSLRQWAHLTWQAADPGEFAAELGRQLGIEIEPHPEAPGSFVLDLGMATVEIVAWQRETPDDDPSPSGRLVFEPLPGGAPKPRIESLPDLLLAGVGWATVELDRAESELAEWLAGEPPDPDDDVTDAHLGARARVRDADGLPGDTMVLLEPTTEGRLAASLVRDGEGPCALYLWAPLGIDAWIAAAKGRGVVVSTRAAGPFGEAVLIPGRGPAGPHLVVVERL
jgi:hypothetical protein